MTAVISRRAARGRLRVTAAASLAATVGVVSGCAAMGTPDAEDSPSTAVAEAEEFLADWVDEDGRVVRRDQGDDTVSEGQAYGLLAAVVADDEDRFDDIWTWTTDELLRDDGLLAWRWADGAVVDAEPASDAELDAARALVLAGAQFDRDDLHDDGVAMSDALLDDLTVETALGRILLPGLWAQDRDPVPYNPSYASPAAYQVLEEATGDDRWAELAAGSAAVTEALLEAAALPPDWAQISADGTVSPSAGAFGEGDPVQYGYDAQRTLIRYAESCEASDRALIDDTLPALSYADEPAAELDLGGGALSGDRSALSIMARAAAAAVDGEDAAAQADIDRAVALSDDAPTYYGQAWVALGAAMLDGALGGCATLEEEAS